MVKEERITETVVLLLFSPSWGTAPQQSIPTQQGTKRGFLKGDWKNLITLCMRDLFQTLLRGLPELPKAKDRLQKLYLCTWREELMTALLNSL